MASITNGVNCLGVNYPWLQLPWRQLPWRQLPVASIAWRQLPGANCPWRQLPWHRFTNFWPPPKLIAYLIFLCNMCYFRLLNKVCVVLLLLAVITLFVQFMTKLQSHKFVCKNDIIVHCGEWGWTTKNRKAFLLLLHHMYKQANKTIGFMDQTKDGATLLLSSSSRMELY